MQSDAESKPGTHHNQPQWAVKAGAKGHRGVAPDPSRATYGRSLGQQSGAALSQVPSRAVSRGRVLAFGQGLGQCQEHVQVGHL